MPYKDPYNAYLRGIRRRQEKKEELKQYQKQWHKDNPDKFKRTSEPNRKKWDDEHTEYRHKQQVAERIAQKLPLGPECELCPNEDNLPLVKHHPDYDYPTIIVTVCKGCHKEIHLDPNSDKPTPYKNGEKPKEKCRGNEHQTQLARVAPNPKAVINTVTSVTYCLVRNTMNPPTTAEIIAAAFGS